MRPAIYALCEPDTGEIRYIGLSSNPGARLSHHWARRHDGSPVGRWLLQLERADVRPELRVVAECCCKVTARRGSWGGVYFEQEVIAQYASPRLLNKAHNPSRAERWGGRAA